MTKRIDELVLDVCGSADHPLAPLLRQGCGESRPFLAFVEAHASKIRKKARLAPSGDPLADVSAELAVAALLARDRRFSVLYEPRRAAGLRGPDLEVAFKARSFYVEVTRLRLTDPTADAPAEVALRLARAACDKIGQCPPSAVNLLAVVVPHSAQSDDLVPAAMRLLTGYSQTGASPSSGLRPEGVRAYLRGRQRLSAVALCSFDDWQPLAVRLWPNSQAKHPLPPEVARYLAGAAP